MTFRLWRCFCICSCICICHFWHFWKWDWWVEAGKLPGIVFLLPLTPTSYKTSGQIPIISHPTWILIWIYICFVFLLVCFGFGCVCGCVLVFVCVCLCICVCLWIYPYLCRCLCHKIGLSFKISLFKWIWMKRPNIFLTLQVRVNKSWSDECVEFMWVEHFE